MVRKTQIIKDDLKYLNCPKWLLHYVLVGMTYMAYP